MPVLLRNAKALQLLSAATLLTCTVLHCFQDDSLNPTFFPRELLESPVTPVNKKHLRKTLPRPDSDEFKKLDAVSMPYVYFPV